MKEFRTLADGASTDGWENAEVEDVARPAVDHSQWGASTESDDNTRPTAPTHTPHVCCLYGAQTDRLWSGDDGKDDRHICTCCMIREVDSDHLFDMLTPIRKAQFIARQEYAAGGGRLAAPPDSRHSRSADNELYRDCCFGWMEEGLHYKRPLPDGLIYCLHCDWNCVPFRDGVGDDWEQDMYDMHRHLDETHPEAGMSRNLLN